MKIAISVPDPIFHEAELLAAALNKSRSQLYSEALAGYVRSHSAYDITQRINAVLERESGLVGKTDDPTSLEPAFAAAQFKMVARAAW